MLKHFAFLSLALVLGFLAITSITGCEGETGPVGPPGPAGASLAINTIHAVPFLIAPADTAIVTVSVSYIGGETLNYQWTAEDGTILGTGAVIRWIAPLLPGDYILSVTVSDGQHSALGHVTINVKLPEPITMTTCNVWPNERTIDHQPIYAIDNYIDTYTWSTAVNNTVGACIAVGFEQLTTVSRIRIWKDIDGTGHGHPIAKDLTIFTTMDEGTLEHRTWNRVSGLSGGYNGIESFVADSISTDGFVWGDMHNSVGDDHGWGSLVFDPVWATGICIQFENSEGASHQYVHYKLHEIEGYR